MTTRKRSARRAESSAGVPFSAFEPSLKKGIVALYAFIGSDSYIRNSCVRQVCAAAGTQDRPVGPTEFEGGRCRVRDVMDELRTVPLFDERRLVCVDGANEFIEMAAGEGMDEWPDFGGKSVLILLGEKLDRRRKLSKNLLERGVLVDCDHMGESELRKWLTARITNAGKTAPPAVTARIIERIGPSASSLAQAVEQLITYAGRKGEITPELVVEALPSATSEEVWSLTDGVAGRDGTRCLRVIQDLLSRGEAVQMVMGALTWHARRLLNAKYLLRQGLRPQDAFGKVGVFRSMFERFKTQLARFTIRELERYLALLTETDLLLKSTSGSGTRQATERLFLERMVLEMCV